jgi:hypothetical protein
MAETGKSNANSSKTASSASAVADTLRRNALPLAGAIAGAAAATAAAIFFTRRDPDAPAQGHPVPDLERADHPGPEDRAEPHFRPDMDAPLTEADRAALAPALGKPTLVNG